MNFKLIKNPMENNATRVAYNALATETFGLSFEDWYQSGHFDGSHIPYTLFDDDVAVANISVNLMDVKYDGKVKKYIQLGTVMTRPEWRGKGLQKQIFNEIIADFDGIFDCMFLFANKNVLDFYPKLGFEKAVEYSFEKAITPKPANVKKLDMAKAEDVALFKSYYKKGNSFSAFEVKNGFALEMFYCGGPYSENVFYIDEYDAVVVAETDENTVTCLDIFGGESFTAEEIMSVFGCKKLAMGFTPKDTQSFETAVIDDEDTTLFVLKGGENIFAENKLLFPMIAHT